MAEETSNQNQNSQGGSDGSSGEKTKDSTPANPSHRDWADGMKSIREANAANTKLAAELAEVKSILSTFVAGQSQKATEKTDPKSKAEPDYASQIADLNNKLAAKDRAETLSKAFLAHGVTDPDVQELLTGATASLKLEEIAAFVEKKSSLFGKAQVKGVKPGTSNTGPASTSSSLPDKPRDMSIEAWKSLSAQEQKARMAGKGNPVHAHKQSLKQK